MNKVQKSTFGNLKDNPTEIDSIRAYLHLYKGEDIALDEDEDFRTRIESALCSVNHKKGISVGALLNMSVQIGRWHKFSWLVPLLELTVYT